MPYMAQHKNTTGPIQLTAVGAAKEFFERYRHLNMCYVVEGKAVGTELFIAKLPNSFQEFRREHLSS